MPTAFDIATATLFADPNLAQDASFLPKSGGLVWVRIVMRAPDTFAKVGSSFVESSSQILEVKTADCPLIVPGDQFQIGATIYTVQGEPRRDELNLTWQVDLYAS